jgi:hypothetical protein
MIRPACIDAEKVKGSDHTARTAPSAAGTGHVIEM